MFLCDGDCGEGLNLLLVCGWGARVLKLIEELKDKKEQWPEGAGFPVGGGAWCPHLPSSAGLQTSKTHQATKPLGCLGRTALVQATVLLEQRTGHCPSRTTGILNEAGEGGPATEMPDTRGQGAAVAFSAAEPHRAGFPRPPPPRC